MSHLNRIKNPDLPYPSVAAALRAYVLRPASLDVSASLGTTTSFSGLLRPGFTTSKLCLANYLLCLIAICLNERAEFGGVRAELGGAIT